jgi:hypothetical protein
VCVLFALFLLTRFFILFYVRRVGFEPRTYYLPTCNPTLPQAFDCSLKIFSLSTICCREDVSAISNCRIRSSCCIRCAKSSSCCHFSRVTCCRSPSTRWFSCSSAMNFPFKHWSSNKRNWCCSMVMEGVRVLEGFR